MDPFGIGITGLGAAGAATFGAFGLAFRARRRRLALQAASELAIAAGTGDPDSGEGPGISAIRRAERDRIEALATTQAELALRLDALTAAGSAPEEKLQAMAGQLLGLIRDKNATLETAMTGLDQLRARMKALEEMGEPAEARGLFEGLKARMGDLETRAAAGAAGLEARLAALASGGGASELAERLARLHEARDAGLEAALGRLAPIETRLAGLESGIGAGRETTKRLEAALAALQGEQAQARTEIAALRATAETAPAQVEARVDARVEAVRAELSGRIEAFERAMAARDPQGALDRLAERLEAVQDRLVLIETAENPLAEVSERLSALYAQKDAAVETVLARLAPLEARLQGFERELAAKDPQGALDRFAERLEGVQDRLMLIETTENPLAEVSERLSALYAQKDAAVEAMLGRLAPLETRLGDFERELAAKDPRAAIEQLLGRIEALQGRLTLIEAAGSPLAELSDKLSALHGQKDAAVETVLARLAPLEARLQGFERELSVRDPQGALDRFAEQLEGVAGRVTLIETAESPLAELSERLAQIHAQKEAAVEAMIARLGPVEDRLGGVEREIAAKDPQGALDRFAERLEAVQGRLAAVETTGSPLAEVTETLGSLYAQKEAAVEAVLGRLAPLEAKLAAVEGGLARAAEDDARAAVDGLKVVDGLRARIETLHWNLGETAAGLAALRAEAMAGPAATVAVTAAATAAVSAGVSEAADRLAQLFTGKDTGLAALLDRLGPIEDVLGRVATLEAALGRLGHVETVLERLAPLEIALERFAPLEIALERLAPLESAFERLAPLEARLASLEARDDPEAALAVAGEVAVELAALRADAATQTALFANRLALLEATLPRPAARQVGPAVPTDGMSPDGREASASTGGASDEEEVWALPRIISLHK
jgi:chromosome segregation ATPase